MTNTYSIRFLALVLITATSISIGAEKKPPACSGEAYTQFDFWVGTWDVFVPNGKKAGTNRIEKTLDGCLVLEHWTSARGGAGKSLNFYDPALKKWVQVWVDAGGEVIRAQGGFSDGAMRLTGRHHLISGERRPYRMRYTLREDGSVHQFLEESADDGKTWKVWFDGRYVKK